MKEDFARVVRENWPKTVGYLVAGEPPCIQIRDDEIQHVHRRLVPIGLASVEDVKASGSWFMAVIVCPGDDLSGLAAWAAGQDARRIYFYLYADADASQLRPMATHGIPIHHFSDGHNDWTDLHKVLGWDLNVLVYDDA